MIRGEEPLDVLADFGDAFFDQRPDLGSRQCLPAFACEGTNEGSMSFGGGGGEGHRERLAFEGGFG